VNAQLVGQRGAARAQGRCDHRGRVAVREDDGVRRLTAGRCVIQKAGERPGAGNQAPCAACLSMSVMRDSDPRCPRSAGAVQNAPEILDFRQ